MADIHNEDMILSLNTSLSSMREALDTTVTIEHVPSMSSGDRIANVNIIKAAIANVLLTLQNCGSDRYEGIPAPDPQVSILRVTGAGTVAVGSDPQTFMATVDFMDHNGVVTGIGQPVDVVWSSSDGTVVSINSSTGVYTPLAPGNITITARYTDGSVASVPMVVTE